MLAKKHRLTTLEFDQYFKSGKRYHNVFFQLVVTKNNDFHTSVVVGKKVYKNAVDRNRLRRRLYDVFYSQRDSGNIYICLVKPQAKTLPYQKLKAELTSLLAIVGRS